MFRTLAFCIAALTLMVAARGHGQSSIPPATQKTPEALQRTLQDLENAVWRAARDRDVNAFRELVADDARMVFPSGIVTRQQYLDSMDQRRIRGYAIDNFEAFSVTPEVVITTYKATIEGVFGGQNVPPTTVREGSVWVKRDGKWKAVWNQETGVH